MNGKIVFFTKMLLFVAALIMWFFVGLLLWFPLLFRALTAFSLVITVNAFKKRDISPSIAYINFASSFYLLQFQTIYIAFWGEYSNESTEETGHLFEWLKSIAFSIFFWIITLLIVVYQFNVNNCIIINVPIGALKSLIMSSADVTNGITPNYFCTTTKHTESLLVFQDASADCSKSIKENFFGNPTSAKLSFTINSISQKKDHSARLSITIINGSDISIPNIKLFVWLGIYNSSIRWDFPVVKELRSGERIELTTTGIWIGKPEMLKNIDDELVFNISFTEKDVLVKIPTKISNIY